VVDAPEEPQIDSGFGEFETAVDEVDDDWEPPRRRSLLPLVALVGGGALVGALAGLGGGLGAKALLTPVEEEVEVEEVALAQDLAVLNVNLRDDNGSRILTVRATVDVHTEDPERVAVQVPMLRDSLLLLASDHSAEELLRGRGRERFRAELTRRFALLLNEDRVGDVYLTELVVK